MRIDRPVIIVGTGRCGSTMLHRLLALHDDLGWISTFNEVVPGQPWLSRFSNLYRVTALGRGTRHLPFFPKPFEAYRFWERYLPGFSRRERPQTPEDVPPRAVDPLHRMLARVLAHQGRKRLLVKVTGWSRIGYFHEIFPDARFVWLNREHRAVVSSWIRAGWLDVTAPPDSEAWQWGEVPGPYRRLWEELGGGSILAASLKIQLDLDDIRSNIRRLPDRCYRLEYEDLIRRPGETLRPLLEFCGLPWTEGFAATVAAKEFYDPTDKWKRHLSEEEGDRVVTFFERAERLRASA